MPTLDARLKQLEARTKALPTPGGAARTYAWCVRHGFDVPAPPDGMPMNAYVKLLPSNVLRAILDTRKR